jgi:MFS family permease
MIIQKGFLVTFLTWLCVTMFYCYQYILRMLPNVIMPELMSDFSIKATEFGTFASIYYIGYIAVHIPIGILLSRFGSKIILPACILIAGAGLSPIIYSSNWNMVIFGRLLVGIGSSAAIVGALQIFRAIFHTNFSRMIGAMVSLSLITAMFGSSILTSMVDHMGVKTIINILMMTALALAFVTYILLPKETASDATQSGIGADIKEILRNYKLIIVSLLAGLMVGPLEGFADAWGSAFLNTKYAIDRIEAGNIVSLILIGMCIGCLILPYIADSTDSHHSTTLASGIVMAICFGYLILGENISSYILKGICLLIGIFSAYQVIIISKISTYVPERLSGIGAAIANMIIMAFGSVFHKIIGVTVDHYWDGKISESGIRIYDLHAYINGVSVIPLAIVISIIGFTLIVIKDKRVR